MTAQTMTNARVTVRDGWAVRDLPNGDQVRARVRHDVLDVEQPERYGSGVTLVRERDGYGGIDLDEHDGLARVLGRLGNEGRYWYVSREGDDQERLFEPGMSIRDYWKRCEHPFRGGEDEAQEFVRRYLRAFHGAADVRLYHHTGYSQGDWADIWVIVESEVLHDGTTWTPTREQVDAVLDEWSAWARGDVYIVESEYRTLADAMSADEWDEGWVEHEMPLHGCIGEEGVLSGLADMLYVPGHDHIRRGDLPPLYEVTTYE